MDEENRTRGQRFCSSMCAKSALEKRVFGEHAESQAIQLSAYRLIKKERSAPKPCAHCGKGFKNWRKETIYCSAKCVAQAKPNVVPHIDCVTCGTNFHPQRLGIQCCSLVCSGKYRAEQYRAAYPERACACCRALFRPSKPFGIYCSRPCAHRVGNRKKQAARRSNIIYLTAEIFDEWFKRAA